MIDLHIHSTYSDGSYSVVELLKEAEKKKIEIISITDHDNVGAYEELRNLDVKRYFSGKIIPGCEFKCVFTKYGLPIEILGYGFDVSAIEEFLKYNSSINKQERYLKHLKEVGSKIGLIFDKNIKINPNRNEYASAIFEKELNKHIENKEILLANNIKIETNFYRDAQSNKNSKIGRAHV